MSEGNPRRAGSTGVSVDRPARLSELRTASGTEDRVSANSGAVAAAVVDRTDADERGAAPGADAPTGRGGRRRRGPVVALAAGAAVVVAVGVILVVGRGASEAAGPSDLDAPRVVVAPEAVAEEQRFEAMCGAADVYAIDNMLEIGDNVVADPDGFLAAYETLAVNAPGELKPLIDQMGPLTRKVVAAARSGELSTAGEVQAWLVTTPAPELEAWVGAQQQLAPEILARCA